jgi:hypothetical protein
MTRSEFIQRAVLENQGREAVERALSLADELEKSGKAPWSDERQTEAYRRNEAYVSGYQLGVEDGKWYGKGEEKTAGPDVTVAGNEGRVVERAADPPRGFATDTDIASYAGMTPWLDAVIALKAAIIAKRKAYLAYDTGGSGNLGPYEDAKMRIEAAMTALYKALVP